MAVRGWWPRWSAPRCAWASSPEEVLTPSETAGCGYQPHPYEAISLDGSQPPPEGAPAGPTAELVRTGLDPASCKRGEPLGPGVRLGGPPRRPRPGQGSGPGSFFGWHPF